jgi:hypothetical protein
MPMPTGAMKVALCFSAARNRMASISLLPALSVTGRVLAGVRSWE